MLYEVITDSAYLLGKVFASKMAKQGLVKLCLGRDGRVSSPMIHEALVKGLIESGVDIYDIGVVTTPMMYYCAIAKEFDAGIMITASHNPKEYNGLKMLIKGQSLLGEEIRELGQMIEHLDFMTREGKYQELDISEEYAVITSYSIHYTKLYDDNSLTIPSGSASFCGGNSVFLISG